MSRQQQINNLIERGIEQRLFQAITRQPRSAVPLLMSEAKWQQTQADSLAVRRRLQQIGLELEGVNDDR